MGAFVASQVVKLLINNDIKVKGAKILNLGITFKENCPDIRNSKAIDVIHALEEYGIEVTTLDPWANPDEVNHEYGITFVIHWIRFSSSPVHQFTNSTPSF